MAFSVLSSTSRGVAELVLSSTETPADEAGAAALLGASTLLEGSLLLPPATANVANNRRNVASRASSKTLPRSELTPPGDISTPLRFVVIVHLPSGFRCLTL